MERQLAPEDLDQSVKIKTTNCGRNRHDQNTTSHDQLPKMTYMEDFAKIKGKMSQIEEALASNDIGQEDKKALVHSVLFINEIQIPAGVVNPKNFPNLDRKRTHSPQNRSFFPVKKKASS
ncbi:uncharacterized protein LOC131892541 [Tigriopus californicus]|uniref:uncharacterized protein LOC131892541 n=1 Tax=Tigriopus californicus TaxID=6832 RepID=UPI0027DA03E7|nr:uncharacterized protein LOC131892541 [Tigriopus californicus]